VIMLTIVALLAASTKRERRAAFLWAFAFWDISYYVGLWATIRWPTSLLYRCALSHSCSLDCTSLVSTFRELNDYSGYCMVVSREQFAGSSQHS
jgi:hypothetical protein